MAKNQNNGHFSRFLLEIECLKFATIHYGPRGKHAMILVILATILSWQNGPKRPKMAKNQKRVHFGPLLLEIQGSNFVTSHYRPRAYHALIIVNLAIITIGQNGQKRPKMAKNQNKVHFSPLLLEI